MPYSIKACLPVNVCSEAATCPVAPDPAFLIVNAVALPCVPLLRTPSPCKGGLRCTMCSAALDPTSLYGRAPVRHMSYTSASDLPVREGSGAPRVQQLQIMPLCSGGLRCAMYLTVLAPTSLQGRDPERSVSYDFGSWLHTGRAPVPPLHALWFPVDHGSQTYRKV
jgi:hypothetical protein